MGGGGLWLPSMHHRSHAQHRRGGVSTYGGSASRGFCLWEVGQTPPELEKRAVRILLECFLVSDICLHMGTEVGRGVVPDPGHFSSGYFEKLYEVSQEQPPTNRFSTHRMSTNRLKIQPLSVMSPDGTTYSD